VQLRCPKNRVMLQEDTLWKTTERPTQQSTNTPEIFTQQWPHIRQEVKSWWDRLTDADLDQVAGQKERLVRAIEARYGYARERAEQEVNRQLASFTKTLETSQGGPPGGGSE